MAAVLVDAGKAVTAGDGSMIRMSVPIEKWDNTDDINPVDGTPDIVITGKATDGTVDSDLQIVDPEASLRWIERWHATKSNIRMGHDPKQPVGRGLDIDGHSIRALIAHPVAKHLIRNRILNDFSVGIMNPDIRKGDPRFLHLDPMGKAVNGIITDREDGLTELGEISVVDRGSNYGTAFHLVKSAGGVLEWAGEMVAPDEVLAKAAAPEGRPARAYKSVSVDLPASMRIKVSPSDLAKMNTLAQRNVAVAPDVTKVAEPGLPKAAEPEAVKADLSGSDRDSMPASSFAYVDAQGGKHLPVHDEGHVRSALGRFAQQEFDSAGARKKAARRIVSRARKLGIDLAEHGTVTDAAAKVAKSAAAEAVKGKPVPAKCGKCMGKGMAGDAPCTECKKGAKKAQALLAKAVDGPAVTKKKKVKVMCGTCGARQNIKHANCPECGNPLHPGAIPVMKNHDFTCLGCGHTPLDKGEPHCPGCGKPNPGYLEVADRKLPMNAGKSAKERVGTTVAKGKKKAGKKAKAKKMPPWVKPDADGDGDDAKKATAPQSAKGRKGGKKKGGKGRSPAIGAVSQSTAGVPEHRDGGPALDAFEGDAEMKAAMRHKSLGIDPNFAVLHDLTCPAFAPADVAKCLPGASFAGINDRWWAEQALKAASGSTLDAYNELAALSRDAVTLKTAHPHLLDAISQDAHAAFVAANGDLLKAFRDATPGPGSFPSPSHPMPQQFRRPYVAAGHGAPSPQHDGARSFPVTEGAPMARDFGRGYLTAGHATDSPANDTARPMPVPAPASAGSPESMHFTGMMRANAEQARSAMHDHVSRLFPDVCPMSPAMGDTQKPAPGVPDAAGGPTPHRGKAAKTTAEKRADKAEKAASAAKRQARKARKAARAQVAKAAAIPAPAVQPAPLPEPAGPDPITVAVKAATAPLAKRLKAQDKALRKNARILDAIAGQRDTTGAPFRGAGVAKTATTSAAPAGPQSAAESAEQAQTAHLMRLNKQWRDSWNPAERENAWQEMTRILGISPTTSTSDTPLRPFTH